MMMLSRLLLELRNIEDGRGHEAKQLAYIFHNVPTTLQFSFDEAASEMMRETIKSRAEHFELWDWIEKWERDAFEQLAFINARRSNNV